MNWKFWKKKEEEVKPVLTVCFNDFKELCRNFIALKQHDTYNQFGELAKKIHKQMDCNKLYCVIEDHLYELYYHNVEQQLYVRDVGPCVGDEPNYDKNSTLYKYVSEYVRAWKNHKNLALVEDRLCMHATEFVTPGKNLNIIVGDQVIYFYGHPGEGEKHAILRGIEKIANLSKKSE